MIQKMIMEYLFNDDNKAKIIANHSHRSIGAVISMLVDQEWNKQKPQVKKELKSAA